MSSQVRGAGAVLGGREPFDYGLTTNTLPFVSPEPASSPT
jgi:hypothetical protein